MNQLVILFFLFATIIYDQVGKILPINESVKDTDLMRCISKIKEAVKAKDIFSLEKYLNNKLKIPANLSTEVSMDKFLFIGACQLFSRS